MKADLRDAVWNVSHLEGRDTRLRAAISNARGIVSWMCDEAVG